MAAEFVERRDKGELHADYFVFSQLSNSSSCAVNWRLDNCSPVAHCEQFVSSVKWKFGK